jgi:hypothetical protein
MISREWIQFGREFLTIAVATSLFIGPAGCQLQALPSGGQSTPADLKTLTGLFINDSADDGLLMAARGETDDQFFVYGTRSAAGGIDEVEQIVVKTADGGESFVSFESGRPVHAQGPEGSYLHITYDLVELTRLQARVDLFSVDAQSVDSYMVDIDLQRTANEIADRVREVTGMDVPVTTVTGAGTGKTRVTIFSPFFAGFIAPFVLLINLMTVIIGQIVNFLQALITAVVYSVLLVVLTPFFAIAELLNDTIINIQLVPLFDVFAVLPPPAPVVLFEL